MLLFCSVLLCTDKLTKLAIETSNIQPLRQKRSPAWLTPWMTVLGLELAVVLELERRGCASEGSAGKSPPGGPSETPPAPKSWRC